MKIAIMQCINNTSGYTKNLTVGKFYEVELLNDEYVRILLDDQGGTKTQAWTKRLKKAIDA